MALAALLIAGGACAPGAFANGTETRFDLTDPATSPFPSNQFTVPDASQLTGLRVDLPKPDCGARPSDCNDIGVLNALDGFNLQPRLSVPFTGPIDLETVSSKTVFLCRLTEGVCPGGSIIGINQVIWDPDSNALYAESDEFLDQDASYLLAVTTDIRDPRGDRIGSDQFQEALHSGSPYTDHLLAAARSLKNAAGIPLGHIAAASIFITESATAVMEKIRDQLQASIPAPAEFGVGPSGERTVLPFADVASIAFDRQLTTAPPFQRTFVALGADGLNVVPGAIGTIAFGRYLSPSYETPAGVIPAVGTMTGTPAVQGTNEVYFNLFLPSGPEPPGGWPVVIAGHGGGVGKNTANVPVAIAAKLAQHGFASVAINAAGYGGGPLSTLTVTKTDGSKVMLSAGGRNIDRNGNGEFEQPPMGQLPEGFMTEPDGPQAIVFVRDSLRQTVVDLMQLVREIEVGVDVDGNSTPDLDSSRIYYLGNSLGGMYGTLFAALEPDVRASELGVAGGPMINISRLNAVGPYRGLLGRLLYLRIPSLANAGRDEDEVNPANKNFPFRENLPLRNLKPRVNTVRGAIPIQEEIERIEWAGMSGDPLAYAPHLRKSPLVGVPVRPVLLTFAQGDPVNSNINTTALLRAGDLADRTTFFRGVDAYRAIVGQKPGAADLHEFLVALTKNGTQFALPAQDAVATFLATDGQVIVNPDGGVGEWFETPIAAPLEP